MSAHVALEFGVTLQAYRETLSSKYGVEATNIFDAAKAEAGSQSQPERILAIYRDKFVQARLKPYEPIFDRAEKQKVLLGTHYSSNAEDKAKQQFAEQNEIIQNKIQRRMVVNGIRAGIEGIGRRVIQFAKGAFRVLGTLFFTPPTKITGKALAHLARVS